MIQLISVVLFCGLVGFSRADYCQNNLTLGELPGGILEEALSIILTGALEDFLGCPANTTVPNEDVKLWYYSRNNPDVPILLDQKNPVQIDPSKPIKFLIPGWLCNITGYRMPELKDAYLKRYDCNVIVVDWSARSIDLYSSSFCSIPGVADIIGTFICLLNSQLGIDLSQLHVLGHSMGGQISGLTGQAVQKHCNMNIGRITAMDPAGPLYQDEPESERLDAADATFVQVIHSNQAFLGFYGVCGDVDHFPNCGTFQPGCIRPDNLTIAELLNLPISVLECSHIRSLDYQLESIDPIDNKTFVATSCELCPGLPIVGPCLQDIINPKKTVLGEDCPPNPPAKKFHLTTNDRSPFAKGNN